MNQNPTDEIQGVDPGDGVDNSKSGIATDCDLRKGLCTSLVSGLGQVCFGYCMGYYIHSFKATWLSPFW